MRPSPHPLQPAEEPAPPAPEAAANNSDEQPAPNELCPPAPVLNARQRDYLVAFLAWGGEALVVT